MFCLWSGLFEQPQNQYRHYNNNHVARNINNYHVGRNINNNNASNWIERRRERFIRLQRNSNSPARQRIQGYLIPVFQRLNVHQTIMHNPALGLFVLCLVQGVAWRGVINDLWKNDANDSLSHHIVVYIWIFLFDQNSWPSSYLPLEVFTLY